MTETEVRKSIIEGVKRLVSEGLVARTWGNVSARLDADHFIITPSGKAYENMTEADLVIVKIADCSYEGDIKPSSEKGVHADAYAMRPEINYVIHTHQHYASAVSALGKDIDIAPCAAYGLPGTGKLRKNVAKCYGGDSKAILMERHGAVCLGVDLEDAFAQAMKLEEFCKKLYEEKVGTTARTDVKKLKPYLDDYAQLVGSGKNAEPIEDAEAIKMVTAKNAAAALYAGEAGPMGAFDSFIQRFIYKKKYSKLKDK